MGNMTPDKREVWFETFWKLVDESENYSTIDERITAREKLENHVTQYQQDLMSEVVEKFYQEFGISAEIIDPKADNKFTGKYIRRWNRTPDIKTVARWWEKQAQNIIKSK